MDGQHVDLVVEDSDATPQALDSGVLATTAPTTPIMRLTQDGQFLLEPLHLYPLRFKFVHVFQGCTVKGSC